MLAPRAADAASLLGDGRVLITGGFGSDEGSPHAAAELFDPDSAAFSAAALSRLFATVSPLGDGIALIAGGYGIAQDGTAETWIYRPEG